MPGTLSCRTWSLKTVLIFEVNNPKKAGCASNSRYEKYKFATTVGEALDLGASYGDLENDHVKGFLKVSEETASESGSAKSGSAKAAPVKEAKSEDPIALKKQKKGKESEEDKSEKLAEKERRKKQSAEIQKANQAAAEKKAACAPKGKESEEDKSEKLAEKERRKKQRAEIQKANQAAAEKKAACAPKTESIELQKMSRAELRERASIYGATNLEIQNADDADNPRPELVSLITSLEQQDCAMTDWYQMSPECRKSKAPKGIDPVEVYEQLPDEMKAAFRDSSQDLFDEARDSMDRDTFNKHLALCIDSGLWLQEDADEKEQSVTASKKTRKTGEQRVSDSSSSSAPEVEPGKLKKAKKSTARQDCREDEEPKMKKQKKATENKEEEEATKAKQHVCPGCSKHYGNLARHMATCCPSLVRTLGRPRKSRMA